MLPGWSSNRQAHFPLLSPADETDIVVGSACTALTSLLAAGPVPYGLATPPPPLPLGSGAQQGDEWGQAPEGERATPASVAASLHAAAQARLGAVLPAALARFATLSSVVQVAVPPLLVAYLRSLTPPGPGTEQPKGEERAPLSALPGEVPSAGAAGTHAAVRTHAFGECASLLLEQLHSVSAAAAMAAAEALLRLAQLDGAPASVLAALPSAANAIITAATGAEGGDAALPGAAAAQPRVLALLAGSLRWVPAAQQPLLFRRLLPLVAGIPQAADRTAALARLWSAALAHDWAGGSGRRGAPPQLQLLLLEAGVREIISGSAASPGAAAGAATVAAGGALSLLSGTDNMAATAGPALPSLREELVGTLLYVLLSHPRAAAATALGPGGAAAASGAVAQAAALQAAAEAGEWLSSAKVRRGMWLPGRPGSCEGSSCNVAAVL